MSRIKKLSVRSARKSAHVSSKLLHKALNITTRVEHKATRIIDGTDFSFRVEDTSPLEKVYYNSLPYITPLNPALPLVGQKATVVLLIPSLDSKSFYGGTATALVVAAKAALLKKRPLRIVQTLKTGDANGLSAFFAREGVDIDASIISVTSVADRAYNVYGYLTMHPEDIFIASAWWDAYLINQLPLTKKFIYLVQDFEPIFYNNSDLYVLAESTYKMDSFVPLCNTKLMYDFMQGRNYAGFKESAQWFEPAVSRINSGTVIKKKKTEKKRLFLYGRPDVHRNLFFTALNAIDYALKADFIKADEWEFYMAGQDSLPNIKLSSGPTITNKGKMTMEEYIAFSKTIDVAVSPMMAPHPNYPTLEFASIGTMVVTTKYSNKLNLDQYSKNIITCDIGVESIAGGIHDAAKISEAQRLENLRTNDINTSWSTALDASLEKITNIL